MHQGVILRIVKGMVLVINIDFNEFCSSLEVLELEDGVYVRLLLINGPILILDKVCSS